jgi:NADH-quinone oxidoreductase subunit J
MFKAEFLAFVLVIVYVGAIAVLFLFVVMLLDIKILDKKRGLMSYYPPGVFIVISLAVLFYKVVTGYYYFSPNSGSFEINYNVYTQVLDYSNLQVLGLALFNYYPAFLLLSSCILMVVVIGSVVLTSVKSTSLMKKRQQDVYTQVFYESRVYLFKKNKLDRDGERA